MATAIQWARKQTLAALHIHFLLPFGQRQQRNPLIVPLASWIGLTPRCCAADGGVGDMRCMVRTGPAGYCRL